jgi:hypothetical protein
MRHAGLREQSAPQVWTLPWNVHSQAAHHGPSACTSLAPYVCKVALSNRRIISRKDRTVTFTSRKVGRARPRTAQLDVLEFLRRCLPPGLPHGFMHVRHCGFLPASGAVPRAPIRRRMGPVHPREGQPAPRTPSPPRAARWPTCGAPLRVLLRVGTPPRAFVETS